MAEQLFFSSEDKSTRYAELLTQLQALIGTETDHIANMANLCAALKEAFGWELVLGPFQGPIACTRIQKGKGVCGTSWEKTETLVVPDVDLFPGHIACSSLSKSEIVVPLITSNTVVGVLDVDSKDLATFDEIDARYLKEICSWLV